LKKFKNLTVLVLVLTFALILSACSKYKSNGSAAQNATDKPAAVATTADEVSGAVTISAADSGFSPSSVTIKAGESITWVNRTSKEVEVGSAKHPTHSENPELTGGEFVIKLAPGETKTVSAGSKVGTWGYHDHLNPSAFGKVVIE